MFSKASPHAPPVHGLRAGHGKLLGPQRARVGCGDGCGAAGAEAPLRPGGLHEQLAMRECVAEARLSELRVSCVLASESLLYERCVTTVSSAARSL